MAWADRWTQIAAPKTASYLSQSLTRKAPEKAAQVNSPQMDKLSQIEREVYEALRKTNA